MNSMIGNRQIEEHCGNPIGEVSSQQSNVIENIELLDRHFPLKRGSHKDVESYAFYFDHMVVRFADFSISELSHPDEIVEVFGEKELPEAFVLQNTYLRAELDLSRSGSIRSFELAPVK